MGTSLGRAGSDQTMPSRRRLASALIWAAVVLAIACLQVLFVQRRIPTIEPGGAAMDVLRFHGVELRVTELRATDRWRYGYTPSIHGAALFRVRNTGAPLQAPPTTDPELTEIMRRELERTPWLALAEGLFYLAVLIAGRWVVRVVGKRLAALGVRASLWLGGLSTLVLTGLLLLPYFALGYGGSAFTNLVGPAARSSHGTFPSVGFATGETVSYRTVVEVVLLPVGFLSRALTFGSESLGYILAIGVLGEMTGLDVGQAISAIAFWLSLVIVYAGAGVFLTWGLGRVRRRRRLTR